MIAGVRGRYVEHLSPIFQIIGLKPGVNRAAALGMMILPKGTIFICDPFVNASPTPEVIADYTILAAETIRRFGIEPRAALLSHSNFGSSSSENARTMRRALRQIRERSPELQVDGEMHADAALVEALREPLIGEGPLKGPANLLIMPSLEAANIAYNLLKALADGVAVGPMLLGVRLPCHVVQETINARGITDMTALAVVEAQATTGSGTAQTELPL
jgi:malate dehydrogenase (oxaloacetate-decarboxylating)(NADP+)